MKHKKEKHHRKPPNQNSRQKHKKKKQWRYRAIRKSKIKPNSHLSRNILNVHGFNSSKGRLVGASLVVHWLKIHLLMQWTWVQSLFQEEPTCLRAAKPMDHSYGAGAPEPMNLRERSPCNEKHTSTKSGPCSPKLEKT